MNILILEDAPYRHKAFKQNLVGHVVIIVDNVKEFIYHYKTKQWDAIFLDHDLEGKYYVPSETTNCGMEVIRKLKDGTIQINKNTIFIVHSGNEGAAKIMVKELRDLDLNVIRKFGIQNDPNIISTVMDELVKSGSIRID